MKKANTPLAKTSRRDVKKKHIIFMIFRRTLLVLFTTIAMVFTALVLVLNLIFNGPSPAARDILTMSLIEASATKWIPGIFLDEETVASIQQGEQVDLLDDVSDASAIVIHRGDAIQSDGEWADYPDGIRIEEIEGDTFNAHVMLVRDPSRVYLGISTKEGFSTSIYGKRINAAIEDEGAIAAINAGAFNDDGTTNPANGSVPEGLVYSQGTCVWKTGAPPNNITGFAGLNQDNVLVVHKENISQSQAEELGIRDGCCFGPVLIMNGEVNMEAYSVSGWNPRTAIGQRQDGTILFVCIDGRQASSIGGKYADMIDIMMEYGAVNACNMDGGSSTVMMYRDTYGRYGQPGEVQMINSYSLLQSEPRRMPDYWMVRPEEG